MPGTDLTVTALRPGDVLLSRSQEVLSRSIVSTDGGSYSHASIWLGRDLIESVMSGVVKRTWESSTELHPPSLVDVYRPVEIEGRDVEPIVFAANSYEGMQYGQGTLKLCAVVLAGAAQLGNSCGKAVLVLANAGISWVRAMTSPPEPGPSCTELVARCYHEGEHPLRFELDCPGKFDLRLILSGMKSGQNLVTEQFRAAELSSSIPLRDHELVRVELWIENEIEVRSGGGDDEQVELTDGQLRDLERLQKRIIGELAESVDEGVLRGERVAGVDWEVSFVTPRMVESSPTLRRVGCLLNDE